MESHCAAYDTIRVSGPTYQLTFANTTLQLRVDILFHFLQKAISVSNRLAASLAALKACDAFKAIQ